METHARAGRLAEARDLIDVPRLVRAYYTGRPDPRVPGQRVAFGTSGHRGSSLRESFNEAHIEAIAQAIASYRAERGIDGPLFLGTDTHALSEPARATALEVLAANGVEVRVDAADGYTPTPAVSHAILTHNRGRRSGLADGIVITPSHNPPEDGGLKYNPPEGGPADTETTRWIETRANELLATGRAGIHRIPYERARRAARPHDYVASYVRDLREIVDLDVVRASGLRLGVDPLGGAAVGYWGPIAETYGLDLEIVNANVDPTFRFMALDWDGRIRMDCSSAFAMAPLIALRERFDVAFGNDTDCDRHGIVTPARGLLPPNDYLAIAILHLFRQRPDWPADAGIGKTVVSSGMLDRVASHLGRPLYEMPVGFKWFVGPLLDGRCAFAGEESAGAAFLRRDGTPWTTDKDGIIMDLLAAEIAARSGRDPADEYAALTQLLGEPCYARLDVPATPEQKAALQRLTATSLRRSELAGEPIERVLSEAPANGAAIGGLKVATRNGWFAARPSGTEDLYKVYAESFLGRDHLERIQTEACALVADLLADG